MGPLTTQTVYRGKWLASCLVQLRDLGHHTLGAFVTVYLFSTTDDHQFGSMRFKRHESGIVNSFTLVFRQQCVRCELNRYVIFPIRDKCPPTCARKVYNIVMRAAFWRKVVHYMGTVDGRFEQPCIYQPYLR
jgi:hypothetical protein